MRGSPFFRAAAALVILLLLAPLISRLGGKTSLHVVAPPPNVEDAGVEFQLTFSHRAAKVTLSHLGKTLFEKANPALEEKVASKFPWPAEGIEIIAVVEWTVNDSPCALRVQVIPPGGEILEKSIWGKGSVEEVLLFK